MNLDDIVTYWSSFGQDPSTGLWSHPDDRAELAENDHTLNLDHPTCPYVGRVTTAPVVILGANGGYDPVVTPSEFPNQDAIDTFLARASQPDADDWSNVAPYYDTVNWGPLIKTGDAVWVNASPYRSPRISAEPANQRLIHRLPSSAFLRHWLLEAVLPYASRGDRLVIVKRPGLWRLPDVVKASAGVVVDRAAISKHITGRARTALDRFLAELHPSVHRALWPGTAPARVAKASHGGYPPAGPKGPPTPPARIPTTSAPVPPPTAGMPLADVEPLMRVCALLGLELENPHGHWPGFGKVVHLKGGCSIYVNRRHADILGGTQRVARWDAAGLGKTRPDNDRYLRVMLDACAPRA